VDDIAALSAVALGDLQAQEPQLAAAGEERARELARLLPLVDVRRDLTGHEASHAVSKLLVLLAERGQHRPRAGVLDDAHVSSRVV
jgi:hypothetical protein